MLQLPIPGCWQGANPVRADQVLAVPWMEHYGSQQTCALQISQYQSDHSNHFQTAAKARKSTDIAQRAPGRQVFDKNLDRLHAYFCSNASSCPKMLGHRLLQVVHGTSQRKHRLLVNIPDR